MNRNVSIAAIILAFFVVLAVGGSYWTSHQMNRAADNHGASAGRPGDAIPQDMQDHNTTGTGSAVPPAR